MQVFQALFRTRTGDPLLTMEVERFVGGSENSRFPPCFPRGYADWPVVLTSSLRCLELPRDALNLSPRPVPKPLSKLAMM